ncbi:hypothetical protein L1987_60367 [Smallanthus sonchifolius]|uniref:Uncharacterized protein n=1 Tax=Smallanthus sonchifolius TaxID=185202 RepID=A0ACB9D832_9ASTR|nr:hypothetical protein L1987_60367 [Smallanthus sonchifolius]
MKGSSARPAYKNFRVSSSSSSSDKVERQWENRDEEHDDADYDEHSDVYVDVSAKEKGKCIATYEEIPTQIPATPIYDNMEINKGLEVTECKKNLLEMQTQAYFKDMTELEIIENNMAEVAAYAKELEEKQRMDMEKDEE